MLWYICECVMERDCAVMGFKRHVERHIKVQCMHIHVHTQDADDGCPDNPNIIHSESAYYYEYAKYSYSSNVLMQGIQNQSWC